jgi:hypothetical protein
MENKSFLSLALVTVLALIASAPAVRAEVVDWDSPAITWLLGSPGLIDINGDTVSDLKIEATGSVQTSYPLKIGSPYTGGFTGHTAVQLFTSFETPGGMDVTVTFLPGGLYGTGARNLNYSLFDVDGDGLALSGTDIVSGSQANLVAGGTAGPATMTPTAPFNTLTGPDSAAALLIANDNSAQGTVTTTYGNDAIRSFVFHYDNPVSPANGIALGDLSFDFDISPVPEAGTVAACAVFSLLGAWGLRRMRREQPTAV